MTGMEMHKHGMQKQEIKGFLMLCLATKLGKTSYHGSSFTPRSELVYNFAQ